MKAPRQQQIVKVLEVSLESHKASGVTKILYDFFRYLEKDIIHVDFLTPDGGTYDPYEEDILKHNGRVLNLGIDRVTAIDKLRYNQKFYSFLKQNHYDIVHINSGLFFFCLQVAYIARKCDVKTIIVHSHNAVNHSAWKRKIIDVMKPALERYTDVKLACSKVAALSLFTRECVDNNKVEIINNGIEIHKYIFNNEIREQYRNKLKLDNKKVYGHVGRFMYQKNHTFLLDIFAEIKKVEENAILILVGEGPLEDEIRAKAERLGLRESVMFLGRREDVPEILNCFDAFILPSHYEGLPIVAVEAQTNGLLTICSGAVTEETNISDTYVSIPLSEPAQKWAEIITARDVTELHSRSEKYKNSINAGFDIRSSANRINTIYLSY